MDSNQVSPAQQKLFEAKIELDGVFCRTKLPKANKSPVGLGAELEPSGEIKKDLFKFVPLRKKSVTLSARRERQAKSGTKTGIMMANEDGFCKMILMN